MSEAGGIQPSRALVVGQVGQYVAGGRTYVVSQVVRPPGHRDVGHVGFAVALGAVEEHHLAFQAGAVRRAGVDVGGPKCVGYQLVSVRGVVPELIKLRVGGVEPAQVGVRRAQVGGEVQGDSVDVDLAVGLRVGRVAGQRVQADLQVAEAVQAVIADLAIGVAALSVGPHHRLAGHGELVGARAEEEDVAGPVRPVR